MAAAYKDNDWSQDWQDRFLKELCRKPSFLTEVRRDGKDDAAVSTVSVFVCLFCERHCVIGYIAGDRGRVWPKDPGGKEQEKEEVCQTNEGIFQSSLGNL